MSLLSGVSYAELRSIAARLRSGGSAVGLGEDVVRLVQRVGSDGAAATLDLLADERESHERRADSRIELVWSGPEQEGAGSRETAAVVRQMFANAERHVLVSGYTVFDGASILEPLADRLIAVPSLTVWCCMNIQRPAHDARLSSEIIAEYAEQFFRRHWPWQPRPTLFYDPRALASDPAQRAVLHAKCIVVDDRQALITSANLTEAAYYRNIECGILVSDELFARALGDQFRGLIATGGLLRVSAGPLNTAERRTRRTGERP